MWWYQKEATDLKSNNNFSKETIMKYSFKRVYLLTALFGVCTIIFSACTKTEKLPDEPKNKITAYKIETAEGILFGAIDNINNTIKVYIPYYFDFAIIDPIIELSEGAKLKNEAEPIEIDAQDYIYTVVGADNTTRDYKLIIDIQISRPLWVERMGTRSYLGNGFSVYGNFNTKDATEPKLFIVDEENNEYPLIIAEGHNVSIVPSGNNTYGITGYFSPQNLSLEKLYKVRAKFRGMTADGEQWFEFTQFQPQFHNLTPYVEVKRGDTVTRYASASTLVKPTRMFTYIDGVETEMEIISWDFEKMTFVVPENMTYGITYDTRVSFQNFMDAQIIFNVIE